MRLTSCVTDDRLARIESVQTMRRECNLSVAEIARHFKCSKSLIQRDLAYKKNNPPTILESEYLIRLAARVALLMKDNRVRTEDDIIFSLNTINDGRGNLKQQAFQVKDRDVTRVIHHLLAAGHLKPAEIKVKGKAYKMAGRK